MSTMDPNTWSRATHCLVIDLEATCSDDRSIRPDQSETIEIGAVLVLLSTFQVVDWKRSSRSAGSRSSLARGIEGAIPVPLAIGASSS